MIQNNKSKNNIKLIFIMLFVMLIFGVGFTSYKLFFYNDNIKIVDVQNENEEYINLKGFKEDGESSATPSLFEVSKDGFDTKIYLFGSIHAADDRAYPMNAKIMEAYRNSEYLAVEFDIVKFERNYIKQIKEANNLTYKDGTTIRDHLREETYNDVINYLNENDSYISSYEMYNLYLIDSLISNIYVGKSGLDTDKGIDYYFLKRAKADKKKILEVESEQFQFDLLSGFSDELMDFMIRSQIEYEDYMIENLKATYESWLKGDNEELLNDFDNDELEEPNWYEDYENIDELLEDYDKQLVDNRNFNMTKVVDDYFKEGKNVFVVVGAAHIIGNTALSFSLQELGYTVKLVEY